MEFTSINIRHIYGAQRYCDKVKICCQYKITIDSTITRDYVCDNNIGVINLKQQKSVQARPVFYPDSNIYVEDTPPYKLGASGQFQTNYAGPTSGTTVLQCPKIKCWELVSENIGENISYYKDCTNHIDFTGLSPCPDATVMLTDSTEYVTERTGWLETSYSKSENADNFGRVISESRQCTKFYYDKTRSNIYIAGPLVSINKSRHYNETISSTYIFEECG